MGADRYETSNDFQPTLHSHTNERHPAPFGRFITDSFILCTLLSLVLSKSTAEAIDKEAE
jgi:hypothetical protein